MSITLTLDPRGEQLVAEKEAPVIERKMTPAEAVADIRESRKGITLGGLKIKDLINEAASTDG